MENPDENSRVGDNGVICKNERPRPATVMVVLLVGFALIFLLASFQFLTCLKISGVAYSLDEAGNAKARIGSVVVGKVTMTQLAFGKVTPTSREELKSLFP